MDLFIDQVASEVRKRHKRSLWGNMLLWLNEESSDDDEEEIKKPTKRPSQRPTKATRRLAARIKRPQPTSRPASLQPTASQRPSTQQDPSFPDSDGHKVSVLRRNLIAKPIDNRFLAWESTSVKSLGRHCCYGISTGITRVLSKF